MTIAKFLTFLVVLVAFAACGSATVRTQQQQIEIAHDVYLVLPAAHELSESFNATQAIAAEYEDHAYSFEAHIEARPGMLTIVALNALGGPLFSITYDGVELRAQGAAEAQLVNAEYVLADVLLAHWDIEWLNQRLDGASMSSSESGAERFVTRDKALIIGILYDSPDPWGGATTLTHVERQYVLHITTAEFSRQ